jgi:hypothetical protein
MPDNDTTQILVLQGFSQYFFKNLRDENQHSIYGYFSQIADKIEGYKIKNFLFSPPQPDKYAM